MKTYSLYAKVKGDESSNYSYDEALRVDKKRPQLLMDYNLIEDLDDMTSRYASFEELNEEFKEVYNTNKDLYAPMIIVDKDIEKRDKSYLIEDIVFAKDREELERKDNIRLWLLDYLKNNPQDINKFRGIKDIYENVRNQNPDKNINYLINITILIYFQEHNYKRYREAYFKLKELDYQRVIKNEVHR